MTDQHRKYAIGLAGEFLVAGELLRRGVKAAVTYGNAKKADVVAAYGRTAITLEVKSTKASKWVIGPLPEPTSDIWVLVFLPPDDQVSPEFYILTQAELADLLLPGHNAYNKQYRSRHGREYAGAVILSVRRQLMPAEYRNRWPKVLCELGVELV